MQAARHTMKVMLREAAGRRFWRWPLLAVLALAVTASLFHELPALAGTGGADPVAEASAASAPVEAPGSQAPAVDCHCLCHMAAQAIAAPVAAPAVFEYSPYLLRTAAPPRASDGLPPFRPPRV
jgi:hypothetical protein